MARRGEIWGRTERSKGGAVSGIDEANKRLAVARIEGRKAIDKPGMSDWPNIEGNSKGHKGLGSAKWGGEGGVGSPKMKLVW